MYKTRHFEWKFETHNSELKHEILSSNKKFRIQTLNLNMINLSIFEFKNEIRWKIFVVELNLEFKHKISSS